CCRCGQGRRADDRGGPHRRRRARRVPAAAICAAAQGRRSQCETRYPREQDRGGDRAGRRRQRDGPSGDGAGRRNPNRAGQRGGDAMGVGGGVGVGGGGGGGWNHAGAAGVYAALPLAHAMIGIYSVVASANHMAMWGGAETLLGTNPLAVAIPAGSEAPVVLDMATTVVSYGTVKSYRLQGKPMPQGWMVSRKDGGPLTDPQRSDEGLVL